MVTLEIKLPRFSIFSNKIISILLENILNLGNIGDKVTVKNGYGRNFLLKQGKALRFSEENEKYVIKQKDELNRKNTEIIIELLV